MKIIAIVAAWEPELQFLLEQYPPISHKQIGVWTFYQYQNSDIYIISVVSGVGKVKAACCVQLLISEFKPSEIYMTGICGGLSEEVSGGDIIVAEQSLQHDVTDANTTIDPRDHYLGRSGVVNSSERLVQMFEIYLGDEYPKVHFGKFVSGDQRIRDDYMRNKLREDFNAIAVDQEIAAFAHVSYLNNVEFLRLKSVSDKANNNTVNDQIEYKKIACSNSCRLLIEFLEYRQRKGLFV
ncbi:5'-methylthioadenosine/S-adenosylhomocysteine nucleosidase [Paenibacillus macquariensis]|uniref:adenosylhomocysteine nucleosidase n=1 Tax=Paenibacillus macquariensis TaxID=948756 RepID=A0ABY1JMK7_9BACL|nr:5'-methylthioadenosine/S-adenosylhomocysteine nucleosidase [Paenibacillus macquariensis]MEC0092315.1 5'-methylthioadenosine/S-adenosylhomocysteine nucleosidase [Paenibacillus macquariensis]OAB37144.1 S-adenosylhomocysteine nucleosidase [Paenibacillus macquariensis subsp. macquariensis]SIQ46352.1 adenosylhomocysteine nucleosidase [Paenibacillus macquariensis]